MAATLAQLDTVAQHLATIAGPQGIPAALENGELLASLNQNFALLQRQSDRITGRLHQFQELTRTLALLNSSLELQAVLQEVMDTIIRLANAERAYLMLYERENARLTIQIARNWDQETLSGEEIVFSEGIVRTVMDSAEAIFSVNVQADPRFQHMESVFKHNLQSVLCVPLVRRAQIIGVIYADNGDKATLFDVTLLPLVNAFADQAAIAIENAQLFQQIRLHADDLQHSRERIVSAREEERRRLRRDLHDGFGPLLASLMLRLDVARGLVDHDSDAAASLLADLKGQVQGMIGDIRRVVYDLRPPALDELGLVATIREYATQIREVNVTVVAPESLPNLPAAAEVAAYRIAMEGLTNVVRHAGAHSCRLCLEVGEALELEITDDGRGLPEGVRAGVGLTSIRERAAELGGLCEIESPEGGGTRVWVRLPLVSPPV